MIKIPFRHCADRHRAGETRRLSAGRTAIASGPPPSDQSGTTWKRIPRNAIPSTPIDAWPPTKRRPMLGHFGRGNSPKDDQSTPPCGRVRVGKFRAPTPTRGRQHRESSSAVRQTGMRTRIHAANRAESEEFSQRMCVCPQGPPHPSSPEPQGKQRGKNRRNSDPEFSGTARCDAWPPRKYPNSGATGTIDCGHWTQRRWQEFAV